MKSTLKVTATTAIELTKNQVDKITSIVKKNNKLSEIKLSQVVDPSVIAGIRLTIGSQQYDATVYSKLEKLHKQLKENI